MKRTKSQLIISPITRLLAGVIVLLTFTNVSFSQSNTQVIITWRANNFYPANFSGKPLPTPGTPVILDAEILNAGKLMDLSQANFTWYVDEKIISSGQGLKETVFNGQKTEGDDYFVRVAIELNGNKFENSTRVPAASPFIVIENPNADKNISPKSQASMEIIPYFFNVSSLDDLIFSWNINGNPVNSNNNQLTINVGTPQTPDQSIIQIGAFTQNRKNPLEFASAKTKLFIGQ